MSVTTLTIGQLDYIVTLSEIGKTAAQIADLVITDGDDIGSDVVETVLCTYEASYGTDRIRAVKRAEPLPVPTEPTPAPVVTENKNFVSAFAQKGPETTKSRAAESFSFEEEDEGKTDVKTDS